jgi:hypothetical protein
MEFVCYTDLFPIKEPLVDALGNAEPTGVSAARVMIKGIRDFVVLNSKLT